MTVLQRGGGTRGPLGTGVCGRTSTSVLSTRTATVARRTRPNRCVTSWLPLAADMCGRASTSVKRSRQETPSATEGVPSVGSDGACTKTRTVWLASGRPLSSGAHVERTSTEHWHTCASLRRTGASLRWWLWPSVTKEVSASNGAMRKRAGGDAKRTASDPPAASLR